jgi:hypothetical protein
LGFCAKFFVQKIYNCHSQKFCSLNLPKAGLFFSLPKFGSDFLKRFLEPFTKIF